MRKLQRLNKPRSRIHRNFVNEGKLYSAPKTKPSTTPFLAYDGEGKGKSGLYILLANSLGEEVYNPDGLSTKECIKFLTRRYSHSYIRIFYGFGYDVNMALKDIPLDDWDEIDNHISYHGHRLQYLPGKMLRVDGFTYYDILPFFQCSLPFAIKANLGIEDPIINRGKSLRADLFEALTIDEIREYNKHEMDRTVELADHLRDSLNRIDLPLGAWYGPGAIAKKMFQVYGVQKQLGQRLPPDCYFALENAYYGGRFENECLGKINDVWEYDIHSAYPAVLASLPYFRNWQHVRKYYPDRKFSLWHVSWDLRNSSRKTLLQPLPFRSRDGRLSFPLVGKGWYWQPEVAGAIKFYGGENFTITEGWVAETEGTPFDWVEKLYYQRMELKDAGDGAEYAIKVGINSLYGKTAQRVGSNTYFNVAWAGYITSATRAKLLEAYSLDPDNCISFATDAIYSRRQLVGLQISNRLGDWEEKHYPAGGIFILPGVYILSDGKIQKSRIRGLPNTEALVKLLDNLAERPYNPPETTLRRFISNRLANRAPEKYGPHRCEFIDINYKLGIREPRKRYYDFPTKGSTIRYGAILTEEIPSLPVIWGVNTLHNREWEYGPPEVHIAPEMLFDKKVYDYFLNYPFFDIPESISRQFNEEDVPERISLIEQEGEEIAELEPERIWDTIPVIDADVQELNNFNG